MREIVHLQAGQCGNQIGAKVSFHIKFSLIFYFFLEIYKIHSNKIRILDNFNKNIIIF